MASGSAYRRKLDEMEAQEAAANKRGWLTVSDMRGGEELPPGVWEDKHGNRYTDTQLEELEPTLQGLIRIVHVRDLPDTIQMTWGADR